MDQNPYFHSVVKRCCSPGYHPELWDKSQVYAALQNFIHAANRLDKMKKALFYGNEAHARKEPHPALSFMEGIPDHAMIHKDVMHAILGIASEAGELVERLIEIGRDAGEASQQTHRLNLIEERGDLEWYEALLDQGVLRINDTDIREANGRKLLVRYPEKFTAEAAAERNVQAEMKALDDGQP